MHAGFLLLFLQGCLKQLLLLPTGLFNTMDRIFAISKDIVVKSSRKEVTHDSIIEPIRSFFAFVKK